MKVETCKRRMAVWNPPEHDDGGIWAVEDRVDAEQLARWVRDNAHRWKVGPPPLPPPTRFQCYE